MSAVPEPVLEPVPEPTPAISRVAMLTVHTSPLDAPGSGDAGGLNVYVIEVARRLAAAGVEVEIFTRATSASLEPVVEVIPGVRVRHVVAGPFEGLSKEDLPGQLCAFTAGVMRAVAAHPEGHYHVVHSHYWLSGQVGWLAADRWDVPLVHTMHTMARVKNRSLASGDRAEPPGREIGEAQVVAAADRLIANTDVEARELVELYDADPDRVAVVPPGVDLDLFRPGDRAAARRAVGIDADDLVVLFVGRIQPLKAPDLLLKAAARLRERDPDGEIAHRLRVVVLGGPSGSGLDRPRELQDLADTLGIADRVTFAPPGSRAELADYMRAADLVGVPSHSESFGLVALEAQACGIPVVAAAVGGLPKAVGAGLLVPSHDVDDWADALAQLLLDPARRAELGAQAVTHASRFGWEATTQALLSVYGEAVAHRRATGGQS